MRLVRFTDENNHDVWINPSHVIGISISDRNDDMTDITTLKWIYTVKESVEDCVNKIDIWLS